jgi:hypothetical protein
MNRSLTVLRRYLEVVKVGVFSIAKIGSQADDVALVRDEVD